MSEPKCCSLSHQEPHAAVRELSAEVAALREKVRMYATLRVEETQERIELKELAADWGNQLADRERELSEARALLARLTDNYQQEPDCHCARCQAYPDVRAFLAGSRDEGPRCTCPNPALHAELAEGRNIDPALCARDEARDE